jgi:hypothetical protein
MQEVPRAQLAFVGEISAHIAAELKCRARQGGFEDRLILTNQVDLNRYNLWLTAADIFVQLHTGFGGEAINVIMDAMSAGLPVIVRANGSAAELPRDAVLLLPDATPSEDIAAALKELWTDPRRRSVLAAAAIDHVRKNLSPRAIAGLYHETIEQAYTQGLPVRLQSALPELPEDDHWAAARALAQSFQSFGPKRLLLEIDCISTATSEAGVALRELVRRILINPKDGWAADVVDLSDGTLRHSPGSAAHLLELPDHGLLDAPVSGGSRDTLVLLAGSGHRATKVASEVRRLRRRGVRVVALVQDIQGDGIHETLCIADRLLCTSPAVAEKVISWLDSNKAKRRRPVDVGWFARQATRAEQCLGEEQDSARVVATTCEEFLELVESDKWQLRWTA